MPKPRFYEIVATHIAGAAGTFKQAVRGKPLTGVEKSELMLGNPISDILNDGTSRLADSAAKFAERAKDALDGLKR